MKFRCRMSCEIFAIWVMPGLANACPKNDLGIHCDFGAKVGNYTHCGKPQCIQILYACERAYYPVAHGALEYDFEESQWLDRHPDPRVQRMAECFLESYLEKTSPCHKVVAAG
jgi:hypothetical protein